MKVADYIPISKELIEDAPGWPADVSAWQSFYPRWNVAVEDAELAEQKTAYQEAVVEDIAAAVERTEWVDITDRVRYEPRGSASFWFEEE